MKLKSLIKEIASLEVKGNKEIVINGISSHSKTVGPGFLFLVKKGKTFDGESFVQEAVQGGALAIVSDHYHPFLPTVTQLIHPNPAALEPIFLGRFYDFPANKLHVIGVTGTNGKTTTTFLIRHIFETISQGCGLIGTVEWATGDKIYRPTHTTPDMASTYKLLAEMVLSQKKYVAIEVSSHALLQNRMEGVLIKTAVFTNLTQEHLDYHRTMENYAQAKALLFKRLQSGCQAIVNSDDPASQLMIQECQAKVYSYGITQTADLQAIDLAITADGMEFTVTFKGKKCRFTSKLVGVFNVYNILAASLVALLEGVTLEEISLAVSSFKGVPGRLEVVPNAKKIKIFVDYAHTPDAMENILLTLNHLKGAGKIITVFGCGGNRDQTKRPLMGKVAKQLSDMVILTTDNPRKEDPDDIIRHILEGIDDPSKVIIEPDRKLAIEKAVLLAAPSDIILIAGKGHDKTQIVGYRTFEFDDAKVAQQACCS